MFKTGEFSDLTKFQEFQEFTSSFWTIYWSCSFGPSIWTICWSWAFFEAPKRTFWRSKFCIFGFGPPNFGPFIGDALARPAANKPSGSGRGRPAITHGPMPGAGCSRWTWPAAPALVWSLRPAWRCFRLSACRNKARLRCFGHEMRELIAASTPQKKKKDSICCRVWCPCTRTPHRLT